MWSCVYYPRRRWRWVWRPRQYPGNRPGISSRSACGAGRPRPLGTTANDSCLVSRGRLLNTRRAPTISGTVDSSQEIASDRLRRSAYLDVHRRTLHQIPNQEAGRRRQDELADGIDAEVQSEAWRAVVPRCVQAFGACQDLPTQARPGIDLRVRPRPRRDIGLQNAGGNCNAGGYPVETFLGGNHVFITDRCRIDAPDGHVSVPATDS